MDEAIDEYEEAIRIDPDYAEAHYNLGIIYAGQGLVDKSINAMETYLQLEPDSPSRAAVEEALIQLRAHQGN